MQAKREAEPSEEEDLGLVEEPRGVVPGQLASTEDAQPEFRADFEKLNKYADREYRKACVNTDPNNIEQEYLRVPADFAYWEEQLQIAQHGLDLGRLELQEAEAEIFKNTKDNQKGLKRGDSLSVEGINAVVTTAPKVRQLRREVLDRTLDVALLRAMVRSVERKADMVQSFGAFRRAGLGNTRRMN